MPASWPTEASPLSNRFPSLATFVMRPQLFEIMAALDRPHTRGVALTGRSGAGKTTLVRVLASEATEMFPGGVIYADTASRLRADEFGFLRTPPSEGRSLIILDEFDAISEDAQWKILDQISANPPAKTLLVGRIEFRPPEGFVAFRLPEFSMAEFSELVDKLATETGVSGFDASRVERLYRLSGGNPVFAYASLKAAQHESVRSFETLLGYLRTFRTAGLTDLEGKPLSSEIERKLIIDVKNTNEEILGLLKRKPELITQVDPRKFEEIVADLLKDMGYQVTLTPASRDGGFDIYAARKDGLGQFLYLVECKRYVPPNKVQVEVVRSLYGVLNVKRASAGAIVTTSSFSSGAREFQRQIEHQMQLHDYIALQKWIEAFPLRRGLT